MNKISWYFVLVLLVFSFIFNGCSENIIENEEKTFYDGKLTIKLPVSFHWKTGEPEGYRVDFKPEWLLAGRQIIKYQRYSLYVEFKSDKKLKDVYFAFIDTTPEANWWKTLSWQTYGDVAANEKQEKTFYFSIWNTATTNKPEANALMIGGSVDDPSILKEGDEVTLTFNKFVFKTERPIESDYQPAKSSGLPSIKINTIKDSVPEDLQNIPAYNYEWIPNVDYSIYDETGGLQVSGITSIRARGNSTRGMPKVPYNLKLDDKRSFLGMPEDTRWVFLANYSDKTLLRTEVAMKFAEIFNKMAWVPRSKQADVYLNENYLGVYQITEKIKIDANRVNISKISRTNGDGGFILEICQRLEDEYNFISKQKMAFNCSDPDSGLDVFINGTEISMFEKIKTYINNVEDVLFSSNFKDPVSGWRKYLDVESFIDYYFVNEITKNNDALDFSSIYMYYDPAKDKLCMGPIWDFDLAIGNNNQFNNPNNVFMMRWSPWFNRLFDDPYFVSAVKSRWNEKKAEVNTIYNFIDERVEYLRIAQEQNFNKWLILDKWVWPNEIVTGSYQGEIDYIKKWLKERIEWFDDRIKLNKWY